LFNHGLLLIKHPRLRTGTADGSHHPALIAKYRCRNAVNSDLILLIIYGKALAPVSGSHRSKLLPVSDGMGCIGIESDGIQQPPPHPLLLKCQECLAEARTVERLAHARL